jgi:hypothetical protein
LHHFTSKRKIELLAFQKLGYRSYDEFYLSRKTATKTEKMTRFKSELPLKLPLNRGNSKAYSLESRVFIE